MSESNPTPEVIKAIVIDPFAKTVTLHEVNYREGFYPFLTDKVGDDRDWNVLFAPHTNPNGIGCQFVLDDWAIKKPGQRFFRIPPYPHPLGGPVVFIGYDEEGDSQSVPEGLFEVFQSTVVWCPEAMKFVRFEDKKEGAHFTRTVIYEGDNWPQEKQP